MIKKEATKQQILENYFEVTSSHEKGNVDYEKRSQGLKRGFGDWLDLEKKDVIELGCGKGEISWIARQSGAQKVVGVTLSQGEIDFASKYVDAEFVREDILDYLSEREAESADRIFAINLLEHLTTDQLIKVLQQASRVLRPHGKLIAMVPNAHSTFGSMTRYWDITHELAFTQSSVQQLMRICHFDHVEFREWGVRPYNLKSSVRYALWQGIRAMIAFRLMVETGSNKGGVYTADMIFRLSKA